MKRPRRHLLQSGVWRTSANSHVSEALSLSLSLSPIAAVPLTLACGPLALLHAHYRSRGRAPTIQ
jgi:ABC-type sulfate transport system permease component